MSFIRGRTLTITAAAAALLIAAPSATAAVRGDLSGEIRPWKTKKGKPLDLTIGFNFDPAEAGGSGDTLTKAVLQFPNNAVHNGKLFPSCTPEMINPQRSFRKCPKGSQIGKGSLRADVPAVPVYNVPGRVTLFNGKGGKSITVHIYATNPVLISHAFSAPIKRTRGKYAYRLTANVPEILQDILQPDGGWFAELRKFETTVGGTIVKKVRKGKRVRKVKRGYIEGTSCPRNGRAPIAGTFTFLRDPTPVKTSAFVRCKDIGKKSKRAKKRAKKRSRARHHSRSRR